MRIARIRTGIRSLNVLLVLSALAFSIRTVVADCSPRPPEEVLVAPRAPRPPEPGPSVTPFGVGVCHGLEIEGDLEIETPRDPGGGGRALADDFLLASTWVSTRDFMECCAHVVRRADGALLALFTGERIGDMQLVRVAHDRAVFRAFDGEREEALEVSREAVQALTGHAPGRRRPQPGAPPGDRPPRWPVPVGKDGLEWRVAKETAEWFSAKVDEVLAEVAFAPTPNGLEVREIAPGAAIAGNGIRVGDEIRAIDGHPVRTRAGVLAYLREEGRGHARYRVEIERGGRLLEIVYDLR